MAFKSIDEYNEERYGGFFLLQNDGDFKDVIFLYQSTKDVLVGDAHYVKSADYSGYVQCCGKGCPACAKNIRVQGKMFIPVYVIEDDEVQFWDRSIRFSNILSSAVFSKFANPSEYVFRITRKGAAGDRNTTYEIAAVGRNVQKPYAQILAEKGITFPDAYNKVCKDMTAFEMQAMLDSGASAAVNNEYAGDIPNYQVTPRNFGNGPSASETPSFEMPEIDIDSLGDDEEEDNVQF